MMKTANPSRTKSQQIVAIGEVLWDVYPEAARFGGAPANFACSLAELNSSLHKTYIVSSVGDDELGHRALAELERHGVSTEYVQKQKRATGQVHVDLSKSAVATYRFATDTAWDNLSFSQQLESLAARTDVVCFGTLGQRSAVSRATIQEFIRRCVAPYKICDLNLRAPYFTPSVVEASLRLCNFLKLNDEEWPHVCSHAGITGSANNCLRQLAERYSLRGVALTRGANGSLLYHDGQVAECPGETAEVIDTVGAGDAFTAAMTLGLLAGDKLATINRHASRVAAFVCTQRGATPEFLAEHRAMFSERDAD